MNTLEKELSVQTLEYNAVRTKMFIPEYGRHLQKLIDLAVALELKEERNKMANYIIKIMGALNPHLRDVVDFQHKLWDQLFIMSNFKLDVDSPYPIPTEDVVNLKPEKLNYPQKNPKYRYYGNQIKYMIDIAVNWEDLKTKDTLILVIANHMKKCYLSWNKDTVEDIIIFNHLSELSNGNINLQDKQIQLTKSYELLKTNLKSTNKSVQTQNSSQNSNKFRQNNNNHNNNHNTTVKKTFVKNNNNTKA